MTEQMIKPVFDKETGFIADRRQAANSLWFQLKTSHWEFDKVVDSALYIQ